MVPDPHQRQGSVIRRENLEFEVLSLLEAEPGISQREMARRCVASLGRMNACMKAMIAMGSVKIVNRPAPRPGPGRAHELTPAGLARRASLAESYLLRKRAELDRLAGQVESLQRAAAHGPTGERP